MKRPSGLTAVLFSLVLSVGLVAYLLSQIQPGQLVRMFTEIYLPSLGVYALLSLLGSCLRAFRYRLLIGPGRISAGGILLVTLIRNSFVELLPAKVGALSYIYLLVRRFGLPLEIGTATFILAAVFDVIALSPLVLVAIFLVGLGDTLLSTPQFSLAALGSLLLLLLLLAGLPALLRLALRITERLFTALGARERGISYLLQKLSLTIEAVEAIQQRGIYSPVLLLSFLLRLAKYGSLYFLLHALLLNQGVPLAALSVWKVILGIAGAELSTVLPVQGIAGFGTWEGVFTFVFSGMGYEREIAVLSGFGLHWVTKAFEYSLGALAILLLALPALRGRRGSPRGWAP